MDIRWGELPRRSAAGAPYFEGTAIGHMEAVLGRRLKEMGLPREPTAFLFPVAFLFVRDGAGNDSDSIAREVRGSYRFWKEDLGDIFDLILPGWSLSEAGEIRFNLDSFRAYQLDLEAATRYRYSGDADLLATHFVYLHRTDECFFDFSHCFCLPLVRMLKDEHFDSVTGILRAIQGFMEVDGPTERREWVHVSDRIFVEKAKKGLWEAIKRVCAGIVKKEVDEVEVFAIRDLSPGPAG